jgi:cell division protein FtsB
MFRAVLSAYEKYQKSKTIRDQSEKEFVNLEQRRVTLENKVEILETDQGKEREIREKFGFVKEGEKVIVLIEEPKSTTSNSFEKKSLWGRFSDLFK